jgi:signal transduction histidine kinase/phage shock protein PspC (stress-responsive transcriptional regulator)
VSDQPGPVLPPGRVAPSPPVNVPSFGSGYRDPRSAAGAEAYDASPGHPEGQTWPAPSRGARPRLRRPTQGRIVAGVAAGLAEHLGIPVRAIRIAFVVATIATSGAGLVAYVLLWALTPQETTEPAVPKRPGRVARDAAATPPAPGGPSYSRERLRAIGVGLVLVVAAGAVLLSRGGVDVHAEIWVPLLVLLVGAAIALRQLDITERARWLAPGGGSPRMGLLRLAGGIVLAVVGILLFVARGIRASDLVPVVVAALAVLLGVGLVLAPWGLRLWRDLERERALRVREVERAEIAAHLHDSVLQTLALIQRKPGDANEVARLARAQERELRDWLYAGSPAGAESLQAAVRDVVAEIEDGHGVPVDLVLVGDRPTDQPSRALVQALREALLNAVRHGQAPVSAYVESSADGVSAFVRDRGEGFDPEEVPTDRLGVRESIIGRMTRHGGHAQVRRVAAGGTEVRLELPAETPVVPTDSAGSVAAGEARGE